MSCFPAKRTEKEKGSAEGKTSAGNSSDMFRRISRIGTCVGGLYSLGDPFFGGLEGKPRRGNPPF